VTGTLAGIAAGSVLARTVGHQPYWSITVILVALFFAFYLMRINYAFMVVGLTVMVSQLYAQLGEFSNALLLLRLEETAIGAAVTIVVVMVTLPLHTCRVLRVALRQHVEAITRLVDHATVSLLDRTANHDLRGDGRVVDAAYQTVLFTALPLRRNLFGDLDEGTARAVRLSSAARHYSRDLVADIQAAGPYGAETLVDLELARETLLASLSIVVSALTGPRTQAYTSSASLLERAESRLEDQTADMSGRLAVRDLKLLDAAMAQTAQLIGLETVDHGAVVDSWGTVDLTVFPA
jgi:uncharacterized membrane protein YccC